MRLIGLTGGIATGKSTVASLLARRGADIVDADVLAHQVVEPGTPALAAIARRFGDGVLRQDGSLDRGRLGEIVFADADARKDLERITHPRVAARMQDRIGEAVARDAPVVVVDIPLLFENNRDDMFEGVLLAWAPRAVQLERMRERDGFDAAAARQRLDAQLPIDAKRARATWVIDNSGSLDSTRRQLDAWWDEEIGL